MGEIIYKDIKEMIGKAAEMLGTTAEKAYEIMYKQGNVKVALNISVILALIVFIIIVSITIRKYHTNEKFRDSFDEAEPLNILIAIAGSVLGISLICMSVGAVIETIQILLNRDFWIIEQVIKMLR